VAAASDAPTVPSPEQQPGSTLIAAVGHRLCRDLSAGPVWLDRLARLDWPEHVSVEDFSFGAVAMMQRLQADPCARALFLTAEVRDREPGTLHLKRHEPQALDPDHVQASISEAGAGVVAIDLLLVIGEYFDVLPAETWTLEVEPVDGDWGDGLSTEVEALYDRVLALAERFRDGRLACEGDGGLAA